MPMTVARAAALALGFALGSLTAAPAHAHHSFAAEFDVSRPVVLHGTVTKMVFSNPHTWIHLMVVTDSGDKQEWMVEGGAPNALVRRGWKRDTLPAGTEIVVEGYQARDGSYRATGGNVTFPDGSQLFVGSAGAGAAPTPQ